MASIQQIEANRRNAQKSTGPRTLHGKAVSRFNALQSGIDAQSAVIPDEDDKALLELIAEYYRLFQPADAVERFWLDIMVRSEWLRRRLCKVEGDVWEREIDSAMEWDEDEQIPAARAFLSNCQQFSRLQRRIDSAERNYHRAQRELERLQSRRQPGAPDPAPKPEPINPAPQLDPQPASIGFVPHLSLVPPLNPRSPVAPQRLSQPRAFQIIPAAPGDRSLASAFAR